MRVGKRMLCHIFTDGEYRGCSSYPSISALARSLRGDGAHFKTVRVQNLGDDLAVIHNGNTRYEIEEEL